MPPKKASKTDRTVEQTSWAAGPRSLPGGIYNRKNFKSGRNPYVPTKSKDKGRSKKGR